LTRQWVVLSPLAIRHPEQLGGCTKYRSGDNVVLDEVGRAIDDAVRQVQLLGREALVRQGNTS
jgi:hypothetical protein